MTVSVLKGKTVIVTGASSGIGRQMARECARLGANLILIARSVDRLERLKKELTMQHEVKVDVRPFDLADSDAVKTCLEAIKLDYHEIHVLINNAGFGIFDTFAEAKLEDIDHMFRVNVLGLMTVTRLILPKMLQQGSGHIINVASIAGKIATPKSTVYSATKHAVLGFSNGLRMELAGTGVHVTAVNPGPIRTNFFNVADPEGNYSNKVGRFMISPEEVAQKVVAAIGTRKREINIPRSMDFGARLYQWFPGLVERVAGPLFNKK
jgi:uncharacterized protein